MSQSGKILHLYVEVRSVANEEGKSLDDVDKTEALMLAAPDILHHAQYGGPDTARDRTSPRGALHKVGSSTPSLASSKSASRHSVSFQLHPGHDSDTLAAHHQQGLPYDELNQLLSALQTRPSRNACHYSSAVPDREPFSTRESHFSGRFTAPPTPSGTRKSCSLTRHEDGGRRSVATFSYIEKAKIKSVEGQYSSLGQGEPHNPFSRNFEDRDNTFNARKRLSDPVWFKSLECMNNGSSKPRSQGLLSSQTSSPNFRRATLDSVAREATHRALEEFGSPQLRQRVAGIASDKELDNRSGEQRRCLSWSGSPVLPCSSRTLPTNATLINNDQKSSLYRLPRSPATDQLSNHAKQAYFAVSPTKSIQEVPNQRPPGCRYRPNLPSCKPTAIQHELPAKVASSQSLCKQQINHNTSDSPRLSHRVNFNLSNSKNKVETGANLLSERRNISPATSPEMARKLAEEATKLSVLMEARRTPSPTPSSETARSESPRIGHHLRDCDLHSNVPIPDSQTQSSCSFPIQENLKHDNVKMTLPSNHNTLLLPSIKSSSPAVPSKMYRADGISSSPVRDPQLDRAHLSVKDSPFLHRHRLHQHSKDSQAFGHEGRQFEKMQNQGFKHSPDSSRVGSNRPSIETAMSLKSHQNHFNEGCFAKDRESLGLAEGLRSKSPSTQHLEEDHQKCSSHCDELNVDTPKGYNKLSPRVSIASQSSSGISDTLIDSSLQEKEGISSETSSKASEKSSDSGKPDLQPSSHSQKIARAKWEFFFGTHSEERETKGSSTAPSSGCPSVSPTPSRPSASTSWTMNAQTRQHKSTSASKSSSSHNVQNVEVELVSHLHPLGSSPKTGIIRRTVKYSETDIDAVPLRCYRETDLDEVMLAEQEEVDSAFGSNRSVLGSSGANSISAMDGAQCLHTDGEEEPLEEEVVSWASVRMQGDKKRQHATPEGDEVFSRLLKDLPESHLDSHTSLKSPISVTSPSRISADGLDSFSRHFESIMESHRAKGTSYSSLDSEDIAPSGPPVFTFDFPTLTPEIQSQICESAKQIIELSFAPLTHETSTLSGSLDSTTTQGPSKESQNSLHQEKAGFCTLHPETTLKSDLDFDTSKRERPSRPVSEFDPDVPDPRAVGGTEILTNGNKADLQAAKRLAKRLYSLDGFKKSDVARHLSKNNDFSRMVAEEYLSQFNFSGMTVDQALRVFVREFALMGETQERERVLSHFSRRFLQCNPNTIPNEDSVHTLTCALMLLNSDLHGRNVGRRMSCVQFISNLEGLNSGQDFPKELLKALYNSIKNEKLQWTIDEEELQKSFSELDGRKDSASHTMKRISGGGNPLISVAQQSSAQVYKNGFLVRKVHADPDGKKTPRGKRGWKTFYAILKGLILYLQKDEYRPDKQLSDEDLKNAVSIHHSLAMRAADYSKRPNVFYLRTADWRVFLFQAPNPEQMQSWITRINTVAAIFSAPPFPAAIGSQRKFSRPLLPGSNTKLPQEDQLKSHETRFRAISSELQELRSMTQERRTKSKDQEEYKQREEYLDFEKTRYGTYAMLLRAKIRTGESDLAAFEARLFDDGGLQRARSSPTLSPDNSHASSTKESSRSSSSAATTTRSSSSSKRTKRSDAQRHSFKQAVK